MRWRTLLILGGTAAGLVVAFNNCSGFTRMPGRGLASNSAGGAANEDEQYAKQDIPFSFRLSALPSTGRFTLSGAPSWLSIDATSGIVSGTAISAEGGGELTIVDDSGANPVRYGPIRIKVLGNPLKAYQWHLTNIGQKTFALKGGTSGEDLHLGASVAAGVTGAGVRIAVSDTGVFESHPGLVQNMATQGSRNYLIDYAARGSWSGDSTPDVSNDGELAHGTAVAGLLAEKGWTDFGGRGVAPDATLSGFLYVQAQDVLATRGYATPGYLDQFAGDFDIFNYSWGYSQCELNSAETGLGDKLAYGTSTLRNGRGAIYIKAAGNEFQGSLDVCDANASPSALYVGNAAFAEENTTPYMIVVAAVNAKGVSASYSSPGANVWISAPGGEFGYDDATKSSSVVTDVALLTTDVPGCGVGFKSIGANVFDRGATPNADCYHTSRMNGTSGAAPLVSGTAALLLQVNPLLTWRDIKHILASTADKVQPSAGPTQHPAASSNLAGHTYQQGWVTNAGGFAFHNWYGFGRVNVDRAVAAARTYQSSLGVMKQTNTSAGWKYSSGSISANVPDAQAAGVTNSLNVSENYLLESVQAQVAVTNCIGQVGVELTSPAGTKSILMNINSFLTETAMDHVFLSNAFYGERSAGTWTLRVVDGKAGCQATLRSWKLNIIGH